MISRNPSVIPYDANSNALVNAIDSGNSTTTQLDPGGVNVFTGTGVDCSYCTSVGVIIHSSHDSAEAGIELQFSVDNTNWDWTAGFTLTVSDTPTRTFELPIIAKYFRIVYTNGDTTTTGLRIQTILHRNNLLNVMQLRNGDPLCPDCAGTMLLGHGSDTYKPLSIDDEDQLRVTLGESDEEPITVQISAGTKSYYHVYLTQNDEPASILSTTGPFDVGGDTLTISVNGGTAQTPTFPTRAAQPGIHFSGPNPATANGGVEKIKVSVDGGALLEVKIGKNLTSGAAIAALLQTQIRALVENGTNVTVEYDTVDYPLRYVFKSGTTGSSSTMHVEKGGDDLYLLLKLGSAGGTEYSGLDADYYHNYEVISFLGGELTDVAVFDNGDQKTKIQTVSGGTSATLQVTAGGANTALQFPTTLVAGTTGSGSNELNVDGSSTNVRYSLIIPTGKVFVAQRVIFYIRDDNAELKKFGGLAQLTYGVKFEVKNEYLPLISIYTAKTNSTLILYGEDEQGGSITDAAYAADGQDLVKAIYDFGAGLRLPQGADANVYVTVQDDLTGLNSFRVFVKGWIE